MAPTQMLPRLDMLTPPGKYGRTVDINNDEAETLLIMLYNKALVST